MNDWWEIWSEPDRAYLMLLLVQQVNPIRVQYPNSDAYGLLSMFLCSFQSKICISRERDWHEIWSGPDWAYLKMAQCPTGAPKKKVISIDPLKRINHEIPGGNRSERVFSEPQDYRTLGHFEIGPVRSGPYFAPIAHSRNAYFSLK